MSVRAGVAFAIMFIAGAVVLTPSATPGAGVEPGCTRWEQTATSQTLMNRCSGDDARRSGRDVVKRYLAYRSILADGRRNALDATQRAWANYRDTYCAEKGAAVSGGSIQPLVINRCVTTLNRRRAYDLAGDRNAP